MGQASRSLPSNLFNKPYMRFLSAFLIFLGSMLVVLIFGVLTYQIYFLDRVYLGVEIDGVDVSQLHRAEVQQLISKQAEEMLARPLTLVTDEGSFTLPVAELGANVDVVQSVNLAYSVGRQGNFIQDMLLQLHLLSEPMQIVPIITFDTGPANNVLLNIANQLDRPARDAQLSLNDDLSLSIIPAQSGKMIDLDASREAIRRAILLRQNDPIVLSVYTVQPSIVDVESTAQQLQLLLSAPLTFTFNDQQWTLSQAELAQMLIIGQESTPDTIGRITLQFNEAALSTYFFDLARIINRQPIDAWFNLDTTTWTLYPIVYSQDGYTLDVAAAVAMTTALLQNPTQHTLELPVSIDFAKVSSDRTDLLGINELVSSATTYFKGSSADRMKNIEVAASKFQGVVIPPGEIFSFNHYLGDVSAENGFVESLIIQGDRTAVGIGGGVCQVSTTAFRAALFGGFELVERWAHGYRVGWYETGSIPGLDATIYTPDVDFRFRNDTNSFILIQTYTDLKAGTVTFNLYGTSPNRIVEISDPVQSNFVAHGKDIYQEDPSLKPGEKKQIDWAKDGMDVTVYRTVTENGIVIHQDTIFSRYRPWQNVYKIGPKKE